MKTKFWYLLLITFLSFSIATMTGCSDDEKDLPDEPDPELPIDPDEPDDPDNPDDPKPPVITVTVTMKDAEVEGSVTDTEGKPLANVNISSGETQTVTNDMGLFTFERIASANGRFRFTFEKNGYFTVTRSGLFQDKLSLQVVMQSKGGGATNATSATFTSTEESTLKADGMEVAIPASSLVTADGKDYSGTVKADMLYLSPDNENFTTMMPGGDMAAVRMDESDATLISYGMVEVSLSDASGNSLQLKDGSKSEMTFPIPESMKNNPPPTIPLWYFNEEAGVWVEEGTATLQGDVYVGSVSHFSWHNLDVPEDRVTIEGRVTDCKNRPVPRTMVTVDQTSALTDSDGKYWVYVPANTPVTVTVKSEDYNFYSPEVSVSVPGHPGGSTVENVNLELPCIPVISGQITNSCSELVGAYVWVEYTLNGKDMKTTPIWTTDDGRFELRIPGSSGKATLWVQTAAGDKMSREFELTGADQVITGLEICEEFEDSSLTITMEGGGSTVISWVAEKAIGMVSDNTLAISCSQVFMAEIQEFSGPGEYTGMAAYYSLNAVGSFENANFIIAASGNGGYDVTVTGTGQAYVGTGLTNASITGKVYLPNVLTLSRAENVTQWSDAGLSAVMPQMPLPIDKMLKIALEGTNVRAVELGYREKTEADYNAVKNLLTGAGFTLVAPEAVDDITGVKEIAYRKDDNYGIIGYYPQGDTDSDMEDCKLVVFLCEGYSKMQGFLGGLVGQPGTRTTTTKVPQLKLLRRR